MINHVYYNAVSFHDRNNILHASLLSNDKTILLPSSVRNAFLIFPFFIRKDNNRFKHAFFPDPQISYSRFFRWEKKLLNRILLIEKHFFSKWNLVRSIDESSSNFSYTISSQYLSDINIELIIELFSDSKLRYQVSRSTQGIGFHLTFPQKILIETPRSPREFNATSGRGGGG